MLQILVEFSSKTWQPKLLARFLIFFLACLVYSHSHRWCYSRWCSWLYHIRDGFETDLTSFKTIYFPLIYSLRYISGIHFTRFHRIHPNPSSDQWIHTRYKHTTTFPRASCINKRFRDRFSPTCTYTLWRKVDSVKKNNLILIDLLISLYLSLAYLHGTAADLSVLYPLEYCWNSILFSSKKKPKTQDPSPFDSNHDRHQN